VRNVGYYTNVEVALSHFSHTSMIVSGRNRHTIDMFIYRSEVLPDEDCKDLGFKPSVQQFLDSKGRNSTNTSKAFLTASFQQFSTSRDGRNHPPVDPRGQNKYVSCWICLGMIENCEHTINNDLYHNNSIVKVSHATYS
jgi:hypothetical protein